MRRQHGGLAPIACCRECTRRLARRRTCTNTIALVSDRGGGHSGNINAGAVGIGLEKQAAKVQPTVRTLAVHSGKGEFMSQDVYLLYPPHVRCWFQLNVRGWFWTQQIWGYGAARGNMSAFSRDRMAAKPWAPRREGWRGEIARHFRNRVLSAAGR